MPSIFCFGEGLEGIFKKLLPGLIPDMSFAVRLVYEKIEGSGISLDKNAVQLDLGSRTLINGLRVFTNVHIVVVISLFDITTTTATNFRSNVKKYLDLVINDSQEVIISRGSESAVLIPLDQFNSIRQTDYLMPSKKMGQVILQGIDDVKNGNFKEVDIDDL